MRLLVLVCRIEEDFGEPSVLGLPNSAPPEGNLYIRQRLPVAVLIEGPQSSSRRSRKSIWFYW